MKLAVASGNTCLVSVMGIVVVDILAAVLIFLPHPRMPAVIIWVNSISVHMLIMTGRC